MPERKQINFTIKPATKYGDNRRVYSNFCAISHTPFDFTLTFCEVLPPTETEVSGDEIERELRAPVRARIAVPIQFVPNLIGALQEHLRAFSETPAKVGPPKGPVH